MDISKINQFRLLKKDLPKHIHDSRYWFKQIHSIEDDVEGLLKVIEYHHEDLEWDAIPDLDEIKRRLDFGSYIGLNMFEDEPIGWNWTNPDCVTIDWKSHYQDLKPNEFYIGGTFFTRKAKPYPNSAMVAYRQGLEHYFNFHKKDTLYLYSDDWNRASSMLCYKCGLIKFNFLS
jgi:hypothetical protein